MYSEYRTTSKPFAAITLHMVLSNTLPEEFA